MADRNNPGKYTTTDLLRLLCFDAGYMTPHMELNARALNILDQPTGEALTATEARERFGPMDEDEEGTPVTGNAVLVPDDGGPLEEVDDDD
jgi:hypothetical protein